MAVVALRAYAVEAKSRSMPTGFIHDVLKLADEFDAYRAKHGDGDPEKGRHRKDDPATVAEMKKGRSA